MGVGFLKVGFSFYGTIASSLVFEQSDIQKVYRCGRNSECDMDIGYDRVDKGIKLRVRD